MSNNFTYQVMADTNKRTVIKLTGELDATGEVANTKIIGQNLKGALAVDSNNLVTVAMGGAPRPTYRYNVGRIFYTINYPSDGYLKIQWDGGTPSTMVLLTDAYDLNIMDNMGVIYNNATNPNGNITFTSVNSGNSGTYTILFEIYKNPLDFDQGQIRAPQDFNVAGVIPPAQNKVYY